MKLEHSFSLPSFSPSYYYFRVEPNSFRPTHYLPSIETFRRALFPWVFKLLSLPCRIQFRRLYAFCVLSVVLIFACLLLFVPSASTKVNILSVDDISVKSASRSYTPFSSRTLADMFNINPNTLSTSRSKITTLMAHNSIFYIFYSQLNRVFFESLSKTPTLDFLSLKDTLSAINHSIMEYSKTICEEGSHPVLGLLLSPFLNSKLDYAFLSALLDDPDEPVEDFNLSFVIPWMGKVELSIDSFQLQGLGIWNPYHEGDNDSQKYPKFSVFNNCQGTLYPYSTVKLDGPTELLFDGMYAQIQVFFSIKSPLFNGASCISFNIKNFALRMFLRAFERGGFEDESYRQQLSFGIDLVDFVSDIQVGNPIAKMIANRLMRYYAGDIKSGIESGVSMHLDRMYRILAKRVKSISMPRILHQFVGSAARRFARCVDQFLENNNN